MPSPPTCRAPLHAGALGSVTLQAAQASLEASPATARRGWGG